MLSPQFVRTRRELPKLTRTRSRDIIQLGEFKGKVVLVNFWATWCPPCRDEIPDLVRLQKKYGNQGLVVIGITFQDTAGPDRIRDFVEAFKINYPIVHDRQPTIQWLATGMGGVFGLPTSKLINRDGHLVPAPIGLLSWSHLVRLIEPLLQQKRPENEAVNPLAETKWPCRAKWHANRFGVNVG